MIGKAISDLMIKPGKSPVFDSPENYGLDYENVSFKAKDGEELFGWIIKGSNDKVCLLYTSPSPRDATLSRMPSSA